MTESLDRFLAEYSSTQTLKILRNALAKYEKFAGKSLDELVKEFSQESARHLILTFQAEMLKSCKQNTVRSYVSAVKSFYTSLCEPVRKLKTLKAEMATGEHDFSTEDLRKMWHTADTRDKGLLSVGCSLGWEISAILGMDPEFFGGLVRRARSENLDFISFDYVRGKTHTPIFGVLTPVAIDSLERWLAKKDASNSLWNLTEDGLNKVLRRLADEAGIVTTGTLRWHLLRKWLISTLAEAGLGEWEVKLVVGKAIPIQDATYLSGLRKSILAKVKTIYPKYLSLVAYENGKTQFDNINEKIAGLEEENRGLRARIDESEKFNDALIKALDTKLGIKIKELYEEKEEGERDKKPEGDET